MLTRAPALKLMLILLAASAILSIISIFARSTIAWQLVGTATAIAVALAITLPAMPSDERRRLPLLQRTYLGYVGILTLIVTGMIWTNANAQDLNMLCWIWVSVGVPCLLIALPALKQRQQADRSLWLAEGLSIWGAYAALGCATLWTATQGRTWTDIGFTVGFTLLGASAVAAAAAIGLRGPSTDRFAPSPNATRFDRVLGYVGIAAAVLAAGCSIGPFIARALQPPTFSPVDPTFWTLWIWSSTLAVPIGVWNLLGMARTAPPLCYLRHLAVLSVFAAGFILSVAALDPAHDYYYVGEWFWAFCILGSTSFLGAIILMRIHRARPVGATPIEQLEMRCPRCAQKSTIGLGESVCTCCGLAVLIDFRDDRCPGCGYDLQGTAAGPTNCPECGRVRQWPGVAPAATHAPLDSVNVPTLVRNT